MPLNLNVPALEDKPAIPAETRPKMVHEIIATLPLGNPAEAVQTIIDALGLLNRQKVGPDVRLKALELYRPTVLRFVHDLAKLYFGQPLPLSAKAENAAQMVRHLFVELAYGYKQAILELESKLFNFGGSKQQSLPIQRSIHALDQLLLVSYLTYSPPPAGIWAEIHQLYLHALQESLQDIKVLDSGNADSINLTYKRALLMALADPHHLTTTDIDRVADYLTRYAGHAQLQPFGKPENPTGIFLVHLNSDKAPVPFAKSKSEPNLRTDILLIVVDLARLLHNQIGLLQANEPPRNLGLPDIAIDQRYLDMLAHLLKQWGSPPKRLFNRANKNDSINMTVGIAATHYFLNGESPHSSTPQRAEHPTMEDQEVTDITLNFADSPIDGGGSQIFSSARWLVVNESAGGMALCKFPGVQATIQIGELLGLRTDKISQWSLGVVRWAKINDAYNLEVGAQMLAPMATAAIVHPVDGNNNRDEIALLLPELASLKQPATLITPRGVYQPTRVLDMDVNGTTQRILITRLLDRTNNFERFQFSVL